MDILTACLLWHDGRRNKNSRNSNRQLLSHAHERVGDNSVLYSRSPRAHSLTVTVIHNKHKLYIIIKALIANGILVTQGDLGLARNIAAFSTSPPHGIYLYSGAVGPAVVVHVSSWPRTASISLISADKTGGGKKTPVGFYGILCMRKLFLS